MRELLALINNHERLHLVRVESAFAKAERKNNTSQQV